MGKSQRSMGRPCAEILEPIAKNTFLQGPLMFLSPSLPFFFLPRVMGGSRLREVGIAGEMGSSNCYQAICPSPLSFPTSSAQRGSCCMLCPPPPAKPSRWQCRPQEGHHGVFSFFLCSQTHLCSVLMACQFLPSSWLDPKYSISGQCTSFALSRLSFPMATNGSGAGSQTPLDL